MRSWIDHAGEVVWEPAPSLIAQLVDMVEGWQVSPHHRNPVTVGQAEGGRCQACSPTLSWQA